VELEDGRCVGGESMWGMLIVASGFAGESLVLLFCIAQPYDVYDHFDVIHLASAPGRSACSVDRLSASHTNLQYPTGPCSPGQPRATARCRLRR
jgi:hypothetical protein